MADRDPDQAPWCSSRDPFVHRADDDTLHWLVGDGAARTRRGDRGETESQLREKARLWYVACTRARDFLILPFHWPRLSNLGRVSSISANALPESDVSRMTPLRAETSTGRKPRH